MSEVFAEVAGSRAAIRELGERGLIRVTGGDRVRFLNGMVTADVSSLGIGSACHSLQLDRKGHILAELWVLVLDDAMLLDSAPEAESALLEALEKHLIADDVELRGVSGWDQIGIEGPDAAAAIEAEIARVPEPGCFERDASGRIWIAGGSLGEGARVLGERAAIEETKDIFRWTITPYYTSLMDAMDPLCPMRQQVVPRHAEVEPDIVGVVDPLDEVGHSPVLRLPEIELPKDAKIIPTGAPTFVPAQDGFACAA